MKKDNNTYKYKFSVVIPIYNVERYLEETIQSVIKQTIGFEKNIQMILVNDGSPDNSEAICLKYKEKYPDNIIYIKQENSGVSSARNNGMKYIQGKYVNFLDSDDKWGRRVFEKVWYFFEKNYDEIDAVGCRLKFFGIKNNYQVLDYKFKGNKIIDLKMDYNEIILSAPSTFIASSALKKLKFDEALKYGEDAVFINKVIFNKKKYGIISDCVYYYRKRVGEDSAVDTSINKKDYYYESISNYLDELIKFSKKKSGVVEKYIQALITYDLMWRMKVKIPDSILTSYEKENYFKKLKKIIMLLDDDVIISQPLMSIDYKMYFLKIKHDKSYWDFLDVKKQGIYLNNILCSPLNKFIGIVFNKISVCDDNIIVHGVLNSISDKNNKVYLKSVNDNRKIFPEIHKTKTANQYSCMGELVKEGYIGRFVIPISDLNNEYEFVMTLNSGKKITTAISFTKNFNLSPNYDSYYILNKKYIIHRGTAGIVLEKNSFLVYLKRVFACWISLLRQFKLKTFAKKILKPIVLIVRALDYKLKRQNIIIMESNPDFSDNTKALFDEMIKEKVNKKYKIVWFVNDEKKFENIKIKNVEFVKFFDSGNSKFKPTKYAQQCYKYAKLIIDSNKYLRKKNKKQIRIHLNHGSPFKDAASYNLQIGEVDNIIVQSKFFIDVESKIKDTHKSKIIPLGFPRNDLIYSKESFPFEKIDDLKANKVILWLPTYRNHKTIKNKKSSSLYGLACINTHEDLTKLNECLVKKNIYVVIKFHPAENITEFEKINLSNILVIKDEELKQKNITLYNLFGKVDALITDYSSVYFDFCLTKKNIGLAISDIDEYTREQGKFQYEYKDAIIGNYMYNNKDLLEFINDVSKGNDRTYKERMNLVKRYDDYQDGKAAERVYEFIKKFL